MNMSNDSKTPPDKPIEADGKAAPFEPVLDEKLSRFLSRMDDELGKAASDITDK